MLCLALCALLWGTAFTAQDTAADAMGSFTFLFCRSVLACMFLAGLIKVLDFSGHSNPHTGNRKLLLTGGMLTGVFLYAASFFQQEGMAYTTAGKSGFITACYIIIVPLLGLVKGHRPPARLMVSVGLALAGMGCLCLNGSLTFNRGDLLTLVCAFLFSLQIIAIDRYAPEVDPIRLALIQFIVVTVLSGVSLGLTETIDIHVIRTCAIPILYAGVVSNGMGYTLQIIGQQGTDPSVASLLMSLESVFAALSGWLILGQSMSSREIPGCALMFTAIVIVRLPAKKA